MLGDRFISDKLYKAHHMSSQFEQIIAKPMKIEYEDGLIALESNLWSELAIYSASRSTTLKSSTLSVEAIKQAT